MKRIKRSMFVFLMVLSVVAILVSACAGQPSAPAAKTAEPAKEQATPKAAAPAKEQPAAKPAASTEPLKIGITFPLSGALANYGELFKQGTDLAVEDVNAKAGASGRKVQAIYEDSRSEPAAGVAAFRKLVSVDKVPAVLTTFTAITLAQIPVADETGVVIHATGAIDARIPEASKWAFVATATYANEAVAIVDVGVKKLGLKNAALIYANNDLGKTALKIYSEEIKKAGGNVVSSEAFDVGATDYRSMLTKLLAAKPDSIYHLNAGGKEVGLHIKQIRELGSNAQILNMRTSEQPDVFNTAGPAHEGTIYTTPRWDMKDPVAADFVKRYNAKYGKDPIVTAGEYYDGLRMIYLAATTEGSSPEQIRQGLLKIKDYAGVTGKMTVLPNGSVDKKADVKVVKDGKFEIWK